MGTIKKIMSKVVIFILAFMASISTAFANDIISKIQTEAQDKSVTDMAWGIARPFIQVVLIIITVIAIIVLVLALFYLLGCVYNLIRGKGALGKEEIKKFGIAVGVSLLMIGGGVFGVLKLGNQVVIEPSQNIIQDQDDDSSDNQQEDTSQE